ncbi:hypothetical protein, partial [Komagataeibacter nataicola]|uniref:hypothetical protein n=1 Tax=Komagataeibacter nataicola TaxID=265960 RepID=UPI0022302058
FLCLVTRCGAIALISPWYVCVFKHALDVEFIPLGCLMTKTPQAHEAKTLIILHEAIHITGLDMR